MRATVTKAFPGVRDGQTYPEDFLPGDEVEGDLARTAVAGGHADVIEDDDEQEKAAQRRAKTPLPPQPNNPPSPAALGQAGLPPTPLSYASPTPGSEPAVPAAATVDGGAETVEGPDTPEGGKTADAGDGKPAGKKIAAPADKSAGSAPENKGGR